MGERGGFFMDNTITAARPDVVALETAPRPTAPPVRVQFSEVLSGGALALVQGAQAAVRALPGAPVLAAAVRGGGLGGSFRATAAVSTPTPEGPTATTQGSGIVPLAGINIGSTGGEATATGTVGDASDPGVERSLAESQQLNLYYLQIQQQVNDQNRTFTLLSNVIEMEHNTAKTAIGNIH
jgi:hypothetical protein